jgi:hypothetical protein
LSHSEDAFNLSPLRLTERNDYVAILCFDFVDDFVNAIHKRKRQELNLQSSFRCLTVFETAGPANVPTLPC